jgi:hypothetical protein
VIISSEGSLRQMVSNPPVPSILPDGRGRMVPAGHNPDPEAPATGVEVVGEEARHRFLHGCQRGFGAWSPVPDGPYAGAVEDPTAQSRTGAAGVGRQGGARP